MRAPQICETCQKHEQSNRCRCHDKPLTGPKSRTRQMRGGISLDSHHRQFMPDGSGILHRRDEPVSAPRKRLNVPWVVGVVP